MTHPDPPRTRSARTGLALSHLGFGAAQLGNLYQQTTDAESQDAVEAAWRGGIRYFDTAPHYGLGLSERRLGSVLAGKPRDDFVLSTKAGRLLVPNPGGEGRTDTDFEVPATLRREWDFSAAGVRRSIEESLERLGLDRLDIVYLHDPDGHGDEAVSEAFPELVRLRKAGVIRAIGAGMNQAPMLTRFIREVDVDVVMVAGRFSLLDPEALRELLPTAANDGVDVVVAGVYNSGLLSAETVPDDAKFDYQQAPAELIARARAIATVCEVHGVTLPEAAVAYPLLHPAVASVVIGMRTVSHVDSSLARFGASVPEELWRDLQAQGLIDPDFPSSTGETR
ncbi:aldo/keto reductase [Microbacterium sp. SSW1-59]|uniref:aldo/keto reductase n=1 Tax=Microbacterium xanthum TaxID=3079794 RepID=UPI002AD363E6|nr:aldo/keto reductase [Microbacterium sp. SSW1-59]MDZ8200357.1 aldo/keto reductase [Microbacterium sp. SSW1-59]